MYLQHVNWVIDRLACPRQTFVVYLQDDAEQISLNIMASTCSYLDGGSCHVKHSASDFVDSEFIHFSDTYAWKTMVQAFQNKTHLSFSLTLSFSQV